MSNGRIYQSALRGRYQAASRPQQKPRKPNTCPFCGVPVIVAKIKIRGRKGGRAFVPYPVERCPPGEVGNIALTIGLFLGGKDPLAEIVGNATVYRSHRDHCAAFATRASTSNPRAAAPKAFSAANFSSKKPARGGNR